jgi:RNA polymerase sigma-70 factor (ECF subfamily)
MSESAKDFEMAYKEYYAEIRRFIFTIARRDADITDDISQNTWQNAYMYYGSLRDAGSVRAWLYSIARNEAKRYFANRHVIFASSAISIDDDNEPVEIIDEHESGFPEALTDRDLLARLLGRLSDDEQRLILLHYAYDVELKEIAQMGGVNYNTLKSTFRRTIRKLRDAAIELESAG